MTKYEVKLDDYVARFYEKVARNAGLPTEQVLADALFRTAGELSQQAIAAAKKPPHN